MAKIRRKQIEFQLGTGTYGTNGSTGVVQGQEYETVINNIVTKIDELDATAGGSIGEWQDSVLAFSNISGLTENPGDRYILTETGTLDVLNTTTNTVSAITVNTDSIVEYNLAFSAWTVTAPTTGMFTSIDSENNSIYRYTGSGWVEQIFEQTYPTVDNKAMTCEITTGDGDIATLTTLAATPTKDELGNGSYVEVEVNGVEVRVGAANDGNGNVTGSTFDCAFANPLSGSTIYVSNTGNTITVTDATGLVIGSVLEIDGSYSRSITGITGNEVTVNGDPITTITTVTKVTFYSWNDLTSGAILRWFGSNAGYQLDASDRISFDYVKTSS